MDRLEKNRRRHKSWRDANKEHVRKKGREASQRMRERHPTYALWKTMHQRCSNPKNSGYADYGARGIVVCERWHAFAAFDEDMGPRPSLLHSIDRRDNDGNYEPGNCRWATPEEQAHNTRHNVFVTFRGETKCIEEWARLIGIHGTALQKRLKNWSLEDAMLTPPAAFPSGEATSRARAANIPPTVIFNRMRRGGLTLEQALAKPYTTRPRRA